MKKSMILITGVLLVFPLITGCSLFSTLPEKWEQAGLQIDSSDNETYSAIEAHPEKYSSDVAKKWHDAGWTSAQSVIEWLDAGWTDPVEAKKWDSISEWGYFSGKDARKWYNEGISLSEAKEWLSFSEYFITAEVWMRNGFTLEDARQWAQEDFIRFMPSPAKPTIAKMWRDAGFNSSSAHEWQAWVHDPVSAKEWIQAGYTATEAGSWTIADLGVTHAKRWRSICGKTLYTVSELLETNPYDIKHKCYFVAGSSLQILGKTIGLYIFPEDNSRRPFYIDFGNSAAPAADFWGIVEGIGAYEYTSTIGAVIITSKLKALEVTLGKIMR